MNTNKIKIAEGKVGIVIDLEKGIQGAITLIAYAKNRTSFEVI